MEILKVLNQSTIDHNRIFEATHDNVRKEHLSQSEVIDYRGGEYSHLQHKGPSSESYYV